MFKTQLSCTKQSAALHTLLILALASVGPVPGEASLSPTAAEEAPPEFAVPFACGHSFVVSQAHATGSHLLNDTWAWDFRMPSGVPIVAAGEGTVRLARGDSTKGGCDPSFAPEANYVVISHPNGLETQYLHLETVVVAAGENVKAGDLLGYSGKTGWACGSHLHFKAARADGSAWNNPSVPARIKGYGDPNVDSWVASPQCAQAPAPAVAVQTAVERTKKQTGTAATPARAQGSPAPAKPALVTSDSAISRPSAPAVTAAHEPQSDGHAAHGEHANGAVSSGTGATE